RTSREAQHGLGVPLGSDDQHTWTRIQTVWSPNNTETQAAVTQRRQQSLSYRTWSVGPFTRSATTTTRQLGQRGSGWTDQRHT
ncbi:hypothetical protein BaRGS_00017521, partial [Batillaria attramentaria]